MPFLQGARAETLGCSQPNCESLSLAKKSIFLFVTIFEAVQGCAELVFAVCKRTPSLSQSAHAHPRQASENPHEGRQTGVPPVE
jgi:hypothetical protein